MSKNTERNIDVEKVGKKWGESMGSGWSAIPNNLLRYQSVLGLDSMDLNLLLNLIRFWWTEDKPPFPLPQKTADEMGVSVRTVYRRLESLEKRGFLDFQIVKNNTGDDVRAYSLKKLADKINTVSLKF